MNSHKGRRGRSGPQRRQRKRGLIVTEGTVTEVQYLQQLRQEMPRNLAVFKVHGAGKDPLRTVKEAIKQKKCGDYDWVVCLVDRDEHRNFDDAFRAAKENGIDVLVSNPCFDVWLLWHFEDMTRNSSSKEVQEKLSKQGVVRGKHLSNSFPVKEYQEARRRALDACSRLEANQIGDNPSSGMVLLLDLLEGPAG